jgi:hypothetical protein
MAVADDITARERFDDRLVCVEQQHWNVSCDGYTLLKFGVYVVAQGRVFLVNQLTGIQVFKVDIVHGRRDIARSFTDMSKHIGSPESPGPTYEMLAFAWLLACSSIIPIDRFKVEEREPRGVTHAVDVTGIAAALREGIKDDEALDELLEKCGVQVEVKSAAKE